MRFGRRAFFWFSFLLLSAASLYCLGFVVGFAMPALPSVSVSSPLSNMAPNSSVTSSAAVSSSVNSPAPKVSSSVSSAIVATADKTAKGRIQTRTILPSSGNLIFQKISVKNNTKLSINLKKELLTGPKLRLSETTKPQVLIVHTHTTECFMKESRNYYTATDKTRTTKQSENMVAVGKVFADTLSAKGIGVIHATEIHDYPEYSGSYGRAADTIQKYLKKYPTIRVVVDLHRDSITDSKGTKSALVTEIKGEKAAQVMLVAGCQGKSVTGFSNWRENFRLAIRFQQTLEVMYPHLARPIYFAERRYNQHLTTGSLLLECGTEANTLSEAKYAAKLAANALASTLSLLKE